MDAHNATSDLHVLAIMAHPDDAELLCGGTLLRAKDQGYRTGILDLTGGEIGSYGTPDRRKDEAARATDVLKLDTRLSAELSDGALVNTPETRMILARHIRRLRPRVVILHSDGGRHPDHRAARELGRDASFVAGLRNAPIDGEPFRPHKVLYALTYRDEAVQPTFVVDISDYMERKLEAVFAYRSQFEGRTSIGGVFGGDRDFRDQLLAQHAHYGAMIRRPYAEPFLTRETMRVDDVVELDVSSF